MIPAKPMFRLAPSAVAVEAVDDNTFRFCFSDESVGRDGHVVVSDGIQTANYLRDPVIPWAHDTTQPPIGRAASLTMGARCLVNIEFMQRDLNPFAGMIRDMVAGKWLRAVSMSWLPIDWKYSTDRNRPGGIDFTKTDLLEISIVPVPALPGALIEARSHGVDTTPLHRWAERALDLGLRGPISPKDLDALRRAAKTSTRRGVPSLFRTSTRADRVALAALMMRETIRRLDAGTIRVTLCRTIRGRRAVAAALKDEARRKGIR
jgi:hypothetical protein